jgi:NADH-quinone oxidoreductase subunit E
MAVELLKLKPSDRRSLNSIVYRNNVEKGSAIPILQEVQNRFGHVSPAAIMAISEATGIPASDLYSIVTFYAQFRLEPLGEHTIKVCHGTACHLAGAGKVTHAIEMATGAKEGGTSKDGKFTHERVACLGCCSLSPVVMVDGEIHARVQTDKVKKLVQDVLKRSGKEKALAPKEAVLASSEGTDNG